MQVGIGVSWEIVVDGQVNTLNVNTTTKDVGGNANTLVEFFELLVAFNTSPRQCLKALPGM